MFYIHCIEMRRRATRMLEGDTISWSHVVMLLVSAPFQLSDAVQQGTSDELARSARSRRTPMYFQTSQSRRPGTGPMHPRSRTPVVRARCLTPPFHQLPVPCYAAASTNSYQLPPVPTCSRHGAEKEADLLSS